MGGLSDFIFGSKPSTNTQQLPTMTPQQQAMLAQLLGGAGGSPDVAGAWNTSAPYQGPLTTDLSPLQSTSLAALEEQAMQRVRGPSTADSTAQSTITGAQNVDPTQLTADFNKYFQGGVEDPMIQDFKQNVIPELSRRYSGSSTFSSDRTSAEAGATGRLGQALSSSRSQGLFDYVNKTKDRALTAAGMQPGMDASGTNILTQLLAAGGVPTALNQQNIAAQYSEFQRQQGAKQNAFAQALALLGIKPSENVVTSTPGTPGFLTSLAGGVGQGVGAAGTKWALSG